MKYYKLVMDFFNNNVENSVICKGKGNSIYDYSYRLSDGVSINDWPDDITISFGPNEGTEFYDWLPFIISYMIFSTPLRQKIEKIRYSGYSTYRYIQYIITDFWGTSSKFYRSR